MLEVALVGYRSLLGSGVLSTASKTVCSCLVQFLMLLNISIAAVLACLGDQQDCTPQADESEAMLELSSWLEHLHVDDANPLDCY